MALNFDPSPYLQAWNARRQDEQNRPDLNQLVSQPLLQGLQLAAETRRQQQLLDFQKQQMEQKGREFEETKRENDYNFGVPISPDIYTGSPSPQMGQSRLFGNQPMQVGKGSKLIDQFNQWRS